MKIAKTRSLDETHAKQAKFCKKEENLMGNIACLFHGLWRACRPKDGFRESRSGTVDTNSSADSGFQEHDSETQENSGLDNVMRYFHASYIINLTKTDSHTIQNDN